MSKESGLQQRHLSISGQVQGVGFRPFVHRLATRLGLAGEVSNDAQGVQVEILGSPDQLEAFAAALTAEVPPLARVEALQWSPPRGRVAGDRFVIKESGGGRLEVGVTPDAAVCRACLQELFDPDDRRYRHPFINCTHCGPRYSLVRRLPYDRPHTSMAKFSLCDPCIREYQDADNRRFHAQPTCCPDCGPTLSLVDAGKKDLDQESVNQESIDGDPLARMLETLQQGGILALKGIGGFHLLCDARNARAVARLRRKKQRPHKPFALMAANLASLEPWVRMAEADRGLLASASAPILLCPRRDPQSLPGVAPGLQRLGVMLPHAPLHYLLFQEAAGRPSGLDWLQQPQPLLLVMTSGNRSGESLIKDNDRALNELGDIADLLVVHNRDIATRCDDSVFLSGRSRDAEPPAPVRLGRGQAPGVIRLAHGGPRVLALGAWLKNTFCLTRQDQAYVSQHIGDLDSAANCRALEAGVCHLEALLQIQPEVIAVDRHPDFFSSRLGERLAGERQLPLVRVQHHHAHLAAVMAEHRLQEPVLGLALDGAGLGDEGALWGGELLRADACGYEHLGGLAPLPLPGGDRAAREPWRLAVAVLQRLGLEAEARRRFGDQRGLEPILGMLEGRINTPLTSSLGRWFDAAAGLLGLCPVATYEAQAAMALESLADLTDGGQGEPLCLDTTSTQSLDLLPLCAELLRFADRAEAAAWFHDQLAQGLALWTARHAHEQGLSRVVLAGGCCLNRRLSRGLRQALTGANLEVLEARALPCNDAGISLGQAWVALNQAARAG